MTSHLELLGRTMEKGFPLGEDVPTVLADPDRIQRMRDALGEIAAPSLVVEMVADQDFRRERPGLDGFEEAWRDWVKAFETFRVEMEDGIESGPHVLIMVRQIGRPRGGATEIENEGAAVFTFEGDRVTRIEFHLDRETALRAAGIDPQSRQE